MNPATTLTRRDIESASGQLNHAERWALWMRCDTHILYALPGTTTGESYCPHCCGLWSNSGAMLNQPQSPKA